jgi:hypothetical protein
VKRYTVFSYSLVAMKWLIGRNMQRKHRNQITQKIGTKAFSSISILGMQEDQSPDGIL